MKIRMLAWLAAVFAAAYLLLGAESWLLQRSIAEKTLRLHVVANSDSEADQAQKLRVRDCILERVSELTAECETLQEAQSVLEANLSHLQNSAQTLLRNEGSSYAVSVSVGTELFGTRDYETFSLPAGEYPSLRVKIGAAQGKNWWCVVFPSLCKAATSDAAKQCAEVGGYDDAESSLITGGEEKYTLRFKTLEWLMRIFN